MFAVQLMSDMVSVSESTGWSRQCPTTSKYRALRCKLVRVTPDMQNEYELVTNFMRSEQIEKWVGHVFCRYVASLFMCCWHFYAVVTVSLMTYSSVRKAGVLFWHLLHTGCMGECLWQVTASVVIIGNRMAGNSSRVVFVWDQVSDWECIACK